MEWFLFMMSSMGDMMREIGFAKQEGGFMTPLDGAVELLEKSGADPSVIRSCKMLFTGMYGDERPLSPNFCRRNLKELPKQIPQLDGDLLTATHDCLLEFFDACHEPCSGADDTQQGKEIEITPEGIHITPFSIPKEGTTVVLPAPKRKTTQEGDAPPLRRSKISGMHTGTMGKILSALALTTAFVAGVLERKNVGMFLSNLSSNIASALRSNWEQTELTDCVGQQSFQKIGYQVLVMQTQEGDEKIDVRPVSQRRDDADHPSEVICRLLKAIRQWKQNPKNAEKTVTLELSLTLTDKGDFAALCEEISAFLQQMPQTHVSSLMFYGTNTNQEQKTVALDDIATALDSRACDLKNLALKNVTLKKLVLPSAFTSLGHMDVIDSHIIEIGTDVPGRKPLTRLDLTGSKGNGISELNFKTLWGRGYNLVQLITSDGTSELRTSL